jgi:hypothetical protein
MVAASATAILTDIDLSVSASVARRWGALNFNTRLQGAGYGRFARHF